MSTLGDIDMKPPRTDDSRCRLVMGDKSLPGEIENPLYRYLTAISKLRLGIRIEQGQGS